jgi:hypothetical protein
MAKRVLLANIGVLWGRGYGRRADICTYMKTVPYSPIVVILKTGGGGGL